MASALVALLALVVVLAGCSGERPHLGEGEGPAGDEVTIGNVSSGGGMADSPAEVIPVRSWFGLPFSGDSLANLDVGGPDHTRVAYRFQAERSGVIESVRPFIVVNTSRQGYAAGTGGTVQVSVVADDGTGLPVLDQVLARGQLEMDLIDGALPEPADTAEKRRQNFAAIPIGGQPVVAGQTYHVVFEQIDADPVANYVGLDLLYQHTTQLGPRPSIDHWGVTIDENGNGWTEYTTRFGDQLYSPIMAIKMTDGFAYGNGYIETFSGSESFRPIDEESSIQVTFEPAEAFEAQQFWLRAIRTGDSGAMSLTLDGDDGTTAAIDVPATTFDPEDMTWIEVPWPVTLNPGVTYQLTLTGADGGAFAVHPLREGTTYAFEPGSLFGGVSRPSDGNGGYAGWHKDRSEDSFIEADLMMAWTR